MARELNEIQYEARADKAHAAAVSAVLGKARILNIIPDESAKPIDFNTTNSMSDIGFRTNQVNARHWTQVAAVCWLRFA